MAFGHRVKAALAQKQRTYRRFGPSRDRRDAILRGFSRWCRLQQARIAIDLDRRETRINDARDVAAEYDVEVRR